MNRKYSRVVAFIVSVICLAGAYGCASWFLPKSFQIATYVEEGGSGVTLSDNGFNVKITNLAIIPANGQYIMKCIVENTTGAEAKFNPDLFTFENVESGIDILMAGKGKMDNTVSVGAGRKVAQTYGFSGNPGDPAAKTLKIAYGKANITLQAK
jgi:hypothetical protein